jgi:site-specific recombinase XerC
MVQALGTPKRHPESGIYLFRKRVPDRLKESVGKSEIKFSLRTRDPAIARIRHLEELAKIERAWSGIDAMIIDGEGRVLAPLQCKSASDVGPAGAVAAGADPAPALPSKAAPSIAGPTALDAGDKAPVPLRPLFKSYSKEAQLSPATVKRWSPVVDRLIGHLGHDDAAAITRADIVAWKDALLDGGMKNVTVRDVYLASTKALFQFAVDQGLLAENPAKEVKVRVRKKVKEREKGFDGQEAAKILAASQGPFSHLISVEMRAARRWLPWIGAYTGARVNEITPLSASDFVKRDGIWMIRIRGANNKTRTFREVPLHSHLTSRGCWTTRNRAASGRCSTTRLAAAAGRIRIRTTKRSPSASLSGSVPLASTKASRRIMAGATASRR